MQGVVGTKLPKQAQRGANVDVGTKGQFGRMLAEPIRLRISCKVDVELVIVHVEEVCKVNSEIHGSQRAVGEWGKREKSAEEDRGKLFQPPPKFKGRTWTRSWEGGAEV